MKGFEERHGHKHENLIRDDGFLHDERLFQSAYLNASEGRNRVDIACNDTGWPIDGFYETLGCEYHHVDFSRSPLSTDNMKAYGQLKKVIENGGYPHA